MSQFAQTLKYIENLLAKMDSADIHEYCRMRATLAETLADHAQDLVQLAKAGQAMRKAQRKGIQGDMYAACKEYDKLMGDS